MNYKKVRFTELYRLVVQQYCLQIQPLHFVEIYRVNVQRLAPDTDVAPLRDRDEGDVLPRVHRVRNVHDTLEIGNLICAAGAD